MTSLGRIERDEHENPATSWDWDTRTVASGDFVPDQFDALFQDAPEESRRLAVVSADALFQDAPEESPPRVDKPEKGSEALRAKKVSKRKYQDGAPARDSRAWNKERAANRKKREDQKRVQAEEKERAHAQAMARLRDENIELRAQIKVMQAANRQLHETNAGLQAVVSGIGTRIRAAVVMLTSQPN
jgi:hypothetical protein